MRLKSFLLALTAVFVATANVSEAYAENEDCDTATAQINNARTDISNAMRKYSRCVGSTQGDDDCSLEFSRLKRAQDDFESAVEGYQSDCS